MFKPYIDLHTHTQHSDGRLTPRELISKAYNAGIRVLSITDHNYTESLVDLCEFAAAQFDEEMTLIQGAEISALYVDSCGNEHELHVVALGFDAENEEMKSMLERHRPDRRPYINQILSKLQEHGIDLGSYEDIVKKFPDTKYIGRMALARCLYDAGYVGSVDQAFEIYLGAFGDRKAYIKNPLRYSSLEEVIQTVIQAQGTPILAHLLYFDLDDGNRTGGEEKDRLVRTFAELVKKHGGVGGMEVFYTRYKNLEERLYLLKMAQKYGLLLSGGSDYHEHEEWETLAHRTSCSACADLLDHLGVKVNCSISPTQLNVVSGFSGVGKGTVCQVIEQSKTINGKQPKIIRSVTNRLPRSENEIYTFLNKVEFQRLVDQHLLLEYNDSYAQNGYGTPVKDVKDAIEQNCAPILEIDATGYIHLLTDGKINPSLIKGCFIVAEAAVVMDRLTNRGTESKRKICARMEMAVQESYYMDLYDAIIINDDIEHCADAVVTALEGHAPEYDFDPTKFRAEMEQILSFFRDTL